jgi:hypothetical protein
MATNLKNRLAALERTLMVDTTSPIRIYDAPLTEEQKAQLRQQGDSERTIFYIPNNGRQNNG